MAQSLSAEEFCRMQEQLIELRTLNYELEGQKERHLAEITHLQEKVSLQEKEIQKSNKIINKSKNKKEYSLLLEENESFQRQFQAQEENFKLQNQTLLLEINRLNEENEAVKKEIERLQKTGSQESGGSDSETRRLRAENAALQKSLTSAQEKFEQEIAELKQKLQNSSLCETDSSTNVPKDSDNPNSIAEENTAKKEENQTQELKSSNENDHTVPLQNILNDKLNELSAKIQDILQSKTAIEEVSQNSEESQQSNSEDRDSEKVEQEGISQENNQEEMNAKLLIENEVQSAKERLLDGLVAVFASSAEGFQANLSSKTSKEHIQQTEAKISSLEKQLKEMSGLQLRLDTELEEKRLLQEQLQQKETSTQAEITNLNDEIAKLTDKIKKKQESYLQLQEEKEKFYSENKKAMDDLKAKKDNEIRILAEQMTKLQEELGTSNQRYFELQEESSETIKELQNSIVNQQSKASSSAEETEQFVTQLRSEKEAISKQLESLNKKLVMNAQEAEEAADLISRLEEKLQSSETKYLELNSTADELREQSKEHQSAIEGLNAQIQQLTEERDKLATSFEETSRLAEKRKSTLDQMAIERQDVDTAHREQIEKLQEEHKKAVTDLTNQLTGEKKLRKEVDDLQQKLTENKTKLQASEEKCSWFERTLTKTEEAANAEKEQNKKNTEDFIEKHKQEISTLNEKREKEVSELTSQIEELNAKIESQQEQHNAEIEERSQEINKLNQELKDKQIENKIAAKKGDQLVKDLKRQYKLERKKADQLQQKLQEALSENRAKQNFEELFNTPGSHQRRNSGDSSILSPNRSDIDSPDMRPPSPTSSMTGLLSEDTTDLIERLADVQQEKWLLEEKVRHLEETGGALADDLMQKSHVIQAYAMQTKIGPINESPKSPSIATLKEKMKSSLSIGKSKSETKKIQLMLEETLMKNVQLQEDIDRLSKQLEKYVKQEEMALENHQPNRSSTPIDPQQDSIDAVQNHSESTHDSNGVEKATTAENDIDA